MSGLEIISKVEIKEVNELWLIFTFCIIFIFNILFDLLFHKIEKKGKKIFESNIKIIFLVVINLIIIISCCFLLCTMAVPTDRYSYVAKITNSVDLKEFSEKYDHIVFNDDGTVSFKDKEIDN